MNRPEKWMFAIIGSVAIMTSSTVFAQDYSQPNDSPAARMRPIGSASVVDQYRNSAKASPAILRETGYQPYGSGSGSVRQTAMQFAFPGGPGASGPVPSGPGANVGPPVTTPAPNFNPPSGTTVTPMPQGPLSAGPVPQQSVQQQPAPQQPLSRQPATLPFPGPSTVAPLPPRSDYAPMNAPSLGNSRLGGGSIANINNCANVTGPSGYSAAFSSPCGGCAPVGYQAPVPQGFQAPSNFQAPPAQIPSPAIMPAAPATGPSAALNPAPVGSLLSFGQERYPVQVGQGLLGQPKAYVPGQTFRNWLRYFTP